jgi:hypothetical protein
MTGNILKMIPRNQSGKLFPKLKAAPEFLAKVKFKNPSIIGIRSYRLKLFETKYFEY